MSIKLFEMEGFLRGKCLPSDMKVNETNAEYLVRKFAEYEDRCAALAAENAGLKEWASERAICDDALEKLNYTTLKIDWRQRSLAAIETPTTDAFLAEVRAQGVEMFAASLKVAGGHEHPYSAVANDFAANLRKGVQS